MNDIKQKLINEISDIIIEEISRQEIKDKINTHILEPSMATIFERLYPYIIIIAIYGLNYFNNKFFKKIYSKLYILILISFIINISWMYKNHPNQNLYFNYFFKNSFDNLFDLDYWGLSINQNLNFINKNYDGKYKISSIGNMDLELNKKFLEKKDRNRVTIVDNIEDANFIIVNKYYWDGNKSKNENLLDNGLEKIYEVLINEKTISSVYKNPVN